VSFAAIILAAGASSRMGRPKALLEIDGETFLDRLTGILSAVASPVIVVLGFDAEAIRAAARRPAHFVLNPDPARGMLSSLQTGLAAVPDSAEGFLFTPVDCPAIAPSTPARLVDALTRLPDALLAVPRHAGRRGHPVACRLALRHDFLALAPDAPPRDVIRARDDRTSWVDVDDPGILADVDDAESYGRLAAPPRP